MEGSKKYDVICIGQAVQDILLQNIPKDIFLSETDTHQVDSLIITAGGDAVNEAVVLARLGDRASIVARLDNKVTGDIIYRELQNEHVDVSLLARKDNCENFISLIFIHPDGNHSFIVSPGNDYALHRTDVDFDIFRQTRAVSAASLLSLGELDTNGIEEIFKIAKEAGAYTFADANFDLKHIGPDAVKSVYPFTDYFMPSLDEAVYLSGEKKTEDIADWFLRQGVSNVILKLGERGSFFKNASESFYMDPYVVSPVDTTGCGDNFVAAFIHSVLKGLSHRECMEFANGAGALNSKGIGAHFHIRSESQVWDFMRTASKLHIER